MSDLYESVQHAGNIVPRLYLLVTVGSAYIKTGEAPVKLILRDLLDMVKGVQQPIRGLFLRYYLLKMMKDKLPDTDSPYAGDGGDVNDAIEFILQNLSEMNRLWVRMQHLSANKDKEQREAERSELRVTVGENIIRLGNLEGLTYEMYRTVVLPKILDIIVICKDSMA
jgi:vacuolar protein sorting-associated protein 35